MKDICEWITYSEATVSQTATRNGIKNVPNKQQLESMELVGKMVFDKVRNHFGVPIRVSSFFRCEKLNKAVGGSKTSQHMTGQAIDMQALKKISNVDIYNFIKDNLDFDQLIWEFGDDKQPAWVHVSYKPKGNRKQLLRY